MILYISHQLDNSKKNFEFIQYILLNSCFLSLKSIKFNSKYMAHRLITITYECIKKSFGFCTNENQCLSFYLTNWYFAPCLLIYSQCLKYFSLHKTTKYFLKKWNIKKLLIFTTSIYEIFHFKDWLVKNFKEAIK